MLSFVLLTRVGASVSALFVLSLWVKHNSNENNKDTMQCKLNQNSSGKCYKTLRRQGNTCFAIPNTLRLALNHFDTRWRRWLAGGRHVPSDARQQNTHARTHGAILLIYFLAKATTAPRHTRSNLKKN